MAKEEKGKKKVATAAAKKTVSAAKTARKTVRKSAPRKKVETRVENNSNIIPIVYMFLLILGISLIFVALTLKIANYINSTVTLTCLGVALVLLIISAFVKKMNE